MEKTLIDNLAKVTLNKAAYKGPICERVLGGSGNLSRAASLGLQNSDILGLIQAHLVMDYCLTSGKSAEEITAFKDGVSGFVLFLGSCATEQAKAKSQEQGTKTA